MNVINRCDLFECLQLRLDSPVYLKKQTTKRIFDICFSLFIFLSFWPIFLLIALLVKTTSKGPIFYGSERVGFGGKQIICWKFRTMHLNAEQVLKEILAKDPQMRKEWNQYHKLKSDSRITKIGKWLRKTSLDELPQFWNVLKGELSVVGPRPVTFEEAELVLKKKGAKMFSIRPGLTGLWQTSGRNNLPFKQRMDLEERYIDKQSFKGDLLLILKTIPLMIFPRGAF